MTSHAQYDERRARLRKIAEETLEAIAQGFYTTNSIRHDINQRLQLSKHNTHYYAPDSMLSAWSTVDPVVRTLPTEVSILEISTLDGARLLSNLDNISQKDRKIGILNFASARKPGGGFINGAQAQEESIARSSTLYPTFMTRAAQQFYTLHNRDGKGGYYSHAMIYSPGVVVFRDDAGGWVEPIEVDVLTSPAVNAGVARKTLFGRVAGKAEESKIERVMRERMARILFLFEQQEVRNLVLGSFGTGVFQNDVAVVARIWAELLCIPGSRFKNIFGRVVFAILGRGTLEAFKEAFEGRTKMDDGV